MIVCSCNVLSDGQVKDCLGPGPGCPRTPAQVYQCLGCSAKCGRCARTIRAIMKDALGEAHSACATVCSAACPLAHASEHEHRHGAPADLSHRPIMAEA